MADAFRGLTIKLGADARPLNSAINSITKSAGQAQQQMNRLNKALKFNPANTKALASMVDLAGDKAMHSARQVQTLKTALDQAARESAELFKNSRYEGRDIVKMASDTKEVYAATQKLRSESTHYAAELQHIYDALKRSAIASKEFTKAKSWGTADKVVKALQRSLARGGDAADKAREKIHSLFKSMDSADGVFESFNIAAGDVEKLEAKLYDLRQAYAKAETDLKALNKVEGFRAIQNQIIAAEAELRQAAGEAARFKSELYALGGSSRVASAVTDVRRLDSALEGSMRSANELKQAFKSLPRNIEAAAVKAHAIADAEDTLKHKLEAARNVLREIESTPGFDKVAATTRNAWVAAEKAESAYADLDEQLKRNRANMERLADTARELKTNKPDGYKNELKRIGSEMREVYAESKKLKSSMGSVEDKMRSANLGKAFAEGRAEAVKLEAELAKLNFQKSIWSKLGGVGQSLRQFGYGMYSTLTPAIMMAGRYAIDAADQVDASYRNMRKTVNGTEEEFEHLKDAAIDFSRTHVTSADTMLEIEAMGGQLGIQVENLEAFAHTVSNLDIATDMDADTIAQDLGKMATVMGMSTEQYDKFGDSLVRLGNNMPAMESDIMTITTRFMGMGKVVGMSADQMLAWSAAATATGQKPEAAGSAMQRFISNMESAVMGSEEKLQKWANVAGMSADEFKHKFETDASGAMYTFVEGLGRMQKSGDSVNQVLKDLGINNVRDKQLLEGLANQMANATDETNVLRDALKMSADAWNGVPTNIGGKLEEAGDAAREAQKKSEGFSGALAMMKNNATALAVELGDGAAPWIRDLGSLFQDLTGFVKGLSPEMKQAAVGVAGLLAVAGPANVALGTMSSMFGHVYNGVKAVQGILTGWTAKLNSMTVSTERGMKANLGLQKALSFASSGKGIAALAAVSAVAGIVATSVQQAMEAQQRYKKATEGVAEATSKSLDVMSASKRIVDDTGYSFKSSAKSADEIIQAQGELVDRMNERADASAKEISTLSRAEEAFDRYLGKVGLTVSEQQKLKSAVELLNDQYGQQYKIVDLANGKIADEKGILLENADAVRQYIEQKKQQAKVDAIAANYADAEVALGDSAAAFANARKELKAYQDQWMQGPVDEYALDDQGRNILQHSSDLAAAVKTTGEAMAVDAQAVDRYSDQLDNMGDSADHAGTSLLDLASRQSTLQSYFGSDADALGAFVGELQKCGVTTEDFYNISATKWSEILSKWDESGTGMADVLKSVGIEIRSLQEQFNAEMGGDAFDQMCQAIGQDAGQLAQALSNAGVSAQMMAQTGAEAFQNLYETSGQNIDLTVQKLLALDQAHINPKELHVEDGQLVSAQGNLIDFDNFKIGDKVYRVTAEGIQEVYQQAEEVQQVTEDVDGSEANTQFSEDGAEEVVDSANQVALAAAEAGYSEVNVTFNTNAGEAISQMDGVNSYSFAPKELQINGNYDEARGRLDELNGYSLGSKSIYVGVTGGALGTLWAISAAVYSLPSYREIRINTVKTTEEHASGGIWPSGIAVPRHMAGGMLNGIVRSATLTSAGIVGEAGAEAVMSMGRRSSIVPLSNKRYVRPFARAVASEMGGGRSVVNNINVVLDYKAGDSANDMARAVERELRGMSLMEG